MLKAIQKEVEILRIKVYSGLSTEDTDTALYEIEQMLFKAMDKQKQCDIHVVSNCTTCNDEINYKGVCEMCYTELKLNDID
tara:strand:+ start:77 stop:319 length:243 start_codon:yes stop_codon:yes gene_type:complete